MDPQDDINADLLDGKVYHYIESLPLNTKEIRGPPHTHPLRW